MPYVPEQRAFVSGFWPKGKRVVSKVNISPASVAFDDTGYDVSASHRFIKQPLAVPPFTKVADRHSVPPK